MGFFREFKEFAMRGNVVDLAVGLIIGAKFGAIVTSAVNDLIMPPIGKLMGGLDIADLKIDIGESLKFKNASAKLADAKQAVEGFAGDQSSEEFVGLTEAVKGAEAGMEGLTQQLSINYGNFLQLLIDFTIVAFAVFIVIKLMNSLQKQEDDAPPPAPPKEEVLLEEIRDLLAKKA